MSLHGFRAEVNDYSSHLARSRILRRVPKFIRNQADYLTYQTAGYNHLRNMIEVLSPAAESIQCIEADEPFTFAVKLMGGIAVNQVGNIEWVKLVETSAEPRAWLGVASLSFHVDSLDTLVSRFETGGYNVLYDDSKQGVVSVSLNQRVQTVNFVEQTLQEVTQEAIDDGLDISLLRQAQPGSIKSQEP
jgi:hypothetical protein